MKKKKKKTKKKNKGDIINKIKEKKKNVVKIKRKEMYLFCQSKRLETPRFLETWSKTIVHHKATTKSSE